MKTLWFLAAALVALAGCGEEENNDNNEHGPLTTEDTSCVGGERWSGGDEESPYMSPGEACIACHDTDREAPSLSVAGTVYGNVADPDNCFGEQGFRVEITDADGGVHRMTSNRAGNFYLEGGSIPTPYTAKVITPAGTVRQMATPQVVTDCNSCHTQQGANLAPGRL